MGIAGASVQAIGKLAGFVLVVVAVVYDTPLRTDALYLEICGSFCVVTVVTIPWFDPLQDAVNPLQSA